MLVGLTFLSVEICYSSSLNKIGMVRIVCLRCSSFSENFQLDTESLSLSFVGSQLVGLHLSSHQMLMCLCWWFWSSIWLMTLNHLHCQTFFIWFFWHFVKSAWITWEIIFAVFYEVKLQGAETFGVFGSTFIIVAHDHLSFFRNLLQISYVMIYFVQICIAVLHPISCKSAVIGNFLL